jgi:hypothetical protein
MQHRSAGLVGVHQRPAGPIEISAGPSCQGAYQGRGGMDILSKMVEASGHHIVGSRGGRDAIKLYTMVDAASEPFGVVIMDLTSGGLGDRETIRRLRERYANVNHRPLRLFE